MSCDHIYKVVLGGDSSVGKSSLLRRFADDTFEESYLATIGVDFKFKTLTIGETPVKLQIWDTAGQQRFRTITSAYYKGAHGVALVYDVNVTKTLENIDDYWLGQVKKYGENSQCIMLLGNKADKLQGSSLEASEQQLLKFNEKNQIDGQLVSAKTGEGVEKVFTKIAEQCIKKYGKTTHSTAQIKTVIDDIKKKKKQFQLKSVGTVQKKKKKCC